MDIKEILTLNPVVSEKVGVKLAPYAQYVWYGVLAVMGLALLPLLGLLLTFEINALIFGTLAWVVLFVMLRFACEALAALKK